MANATPPNIAADGTGHTLFCTDTFYGDHHDRLGDLAPGLSVVLLGPDDATPEAITEATIAFMSRDVWPDRARAFVNSLYQASGLDWFHVMSAGIDGDIFDTLKSRRVRITRSAGASANAMAETVFMFLHGLGRDLRNAVDRYRTRDFSWRRWRELEDRTIAVLGYGPVGQRIVHLALAYNMEPTIIRRTVRGDEPCPARPITELADVAASHDILVAALPINDDTRGIISADVIDGMPPGALFVNVARGALVDQPALTAALQRGHLGGAGLDVFATEPPSDDDPMWDMPNVLITPHNSGASHGSPQRVIELFFDNLAAYLEQQPLLYEIDNDLLEPLTIKE